jgi:hypothetical protein
LAGEQLAGGLLRAGGEAPGSYPIEQGSLVDANNPDYTIAYQAAQMLIASAPLRTPDAVPVAPPETPRVVEQEPSALRPAALSDLAPRTLSVRPDTLDASVQVTLVRQPLAQQDGLITVQVPRREGGSTLAFRFPLPGEVAEQVGADASLQISTRDGQPLPAGLRYLPETRSFVATELPLGTLPLQLLLRRGNKQWVVVIEERSSL